MRCTIVSRAGQVLARGTFVLHQDENGDLRLDFHSDGGRHIQGGVVDPDGDLTAASQVLFREFFTTWGIADVTLVAKANS